MVREVIARDPKTLPAALLEPPIVMPPPPTKLALPPPNPPNIEEPETPAEKKPADEKRPTGAKTPQVPAGKAHGAAAEAKARTSAPTAAAAAVKTPPATAVVATLPSEGVAKREVQKVDADAQPANGKQPHGATTEAALREAEKEFAGMGKEERAMVTLALEERLSKRAAERSSRSYGDAAQVREAVDQVLADTKDILRQNSTVIDNAVKARLLEGRVAELARLEDEFRSLAVASDMALGSVGQDAKKGAKLFAAKQQQKVAIQALVKQREQLLEQVRELSSVKE